MENTELLNAISEMMDAKLSGLEGRMDTKLSDLEGRMDTKLSDLEGRMDTKLSDLEGRMDTKLSDLEGRMDTKLSDLKERVDTKLSNLEEKMNAGFDKMEVRLVKIETWVGKLESDLKIIKLDIDTRVSTTVNDITSCYFDTYKRYQRNNDKMEDAFLQLDVMQSVVGKHSEQIQKIQDEQIGMKEYLGMKQIV